jgi:sugar lactone lactonase YvrE
MIALLLACTKQFPIDKEPEEEQIPLEERYELSSEDLFPESIAWSEEERAFYVGSLERGEVWRIDPDGAETLLYSPPEGWMSLGVKVDPHGGEVWVCATWHYGEEDVTSSIWVLDPGSGALRADYDLGEVYTGAVCNDLAFDPGGDVYISDRESPNVYRIRVDGELQLWFTDPLLAPSVIGQNGVAWTSRGELLVGKYAPAELLRITLGEDTAIQSVAVGGEGLGSLPDGPDGMAWLGEELIVAANSKVFRLNSEDSWQSATSTALSPAEPVASVTVAEGKVYGLKGEVVPWVLGQEVELPFAIFDLGL